MNNMERKRFSTGHYAGNKWGGKYLRAPDIFYTILKKGGKKLVELGKIAKIKRGFTTGANEFFYLDEEMQKKWEIEPEFLKPIIKSPKECDSIIIDSNKLKFKVFICNKPKSELRGTNALKYIEWGENADIKIKSGGDKGKKIKGFHNISSVKNRVVWYSLGELTSKYIIRSTFNEDFSIQYNPNKNIIDKVMYGIEPIKEDNLGLGISLNSSVTALMINLFGQIGLGEGALFISVEHTKKLPILIINKVSKDCLTNLSKRKLSSIYRELSIETSKPIRDQEPKPLSDRAELDNIIFDELGLTKEERKEVYWAVCELVKQRLDKASSLKED